MKIKKHVLVQLIKEEVIAILREDTTLAAFNQPNMDASTPPPAGVLKALRAFMRDGERLHPQAYMNHLEAFSGGGISSALVDVVEYYEDMNLSDKANALKGEIASLQELKDTGDIEGFKRAFQSLLDSLEMEFSGQNVSNDPKASEVNHMMEKKLGKLKPVKK